MVVNMELIGLVLAATVAVLVSVFLYLRRNYGYLESLGIPVDEPVFIFGSRSTMAIHKV